MGSIFIYNNVFNLVSGSCELLQSQHSCDCSLKEGAFAVAWLPVYSESGTSCVAAQARHGIGG